MRTIKKNPCPYCGASGDEVDLLTADDAPEIWDVAPYAQVVCNLCRMQGPRMDTVEDAVREWNSIRKTGADL